MAFYSANKGDRGKCFVDGVYYEETIECDTKKGYAVVAKKDGQGDFIINKTEDAVETYTIRGKVKFIRDSL